MMSDSANPVQQPLTIFEVRPHRGGWQCFEAPGVAPYWVGKDAKQSAVDYAKARAKHGLGEIRVLNPDGSVKQVIQFTSVTLTNEQRVSA
jgi:hypothetical protein